MDLTHSPVNPLDALRSPKSSHFDQRPLGRDSVAGSDFNEIALDDDGSFSPIALTARPLDLLTEAPALSIREDADGRPRSSSFSLLPNSLISRSHKKSASTTTLRSSKDLPFLFSSLEMQEQEETRKAARGSIDGQQKIQEEFARLQKEKADESHKSEEGTIDWDFWGAVISDYQGFASQRPKELAQAIARGIPGTLRGMMWQHMAASKDLELESAYLKLLKDSSAHEKAITRDLGRTFPHHDFFTDGQGIGQENLFNVLKAYSLYDPQVGYCQGLPFIVAILLLNMPDEEAFSLLVRLMHVYDLRGHFLPEMPKLQMRLFQFDRLIEELLPVLHVHFLRQGIKSSMFCSQWFLTMFSYRFPLEIVFRIYDNCLANGIEAIFGFSITLLKKNEEILLSLKFDEILSFLNTRLLDRYKGIISISSHNLILTLPQVEHLDSTNPDDGGVRHNVDEFVNDAVSLRITPFMLDCYRHEYEDLVRETNKHALEIDELRRSNRSLSAQVKNLEASLAQLNIEHVDLLNDLVKQRLHNEEMEEELVRYKLLYAEAMHENQDAQSSHRISLAHMFNLKKGSS